VLFAVGSLFFALASAPGYRIAAGNGPDSLTFFLGSVAFTSAAALQLLQAVRARRGAAGAAREHLRFLPRELDWWACLVQLAGTLYFNISTFNAMLHNVSARQTDHMVWKPDLFGSICFLIASGLAWYGLGRSVRSLRPRSNAWWIVALNLLGSIAFGISAVAAYVVPTTDIPLNVVYVNLGTFAGAVFFFAGAAMMLHGRTDQALELRLP
jgi:hypothetical protein